MAEVGMQRVNELLEDARQLTRAEQERLRDALDGLLASHQPSAEEQLAQRLLQAGLLSEIRPPITDLGPYQNRRPVEITGKPLSEVIIEERG